LSAGHFRVDEIMQVIEIQRPAPCWVPATAAARVYAKEPLLIYFETA